MTWADVVLGNGILGVSANTTNECRSIAIHESLRDDLAEVPESQRVGRLIGAVTERTAMSRVSVYLREACEAVGIPRIGTHALCRMVVDQYYRGGADVGTVAAQSGQSPETALNYDRKATHADRARAVALGWARGAGRETDEEVDRDAEPANGLNPHE